MRAILRNRDRSRIAAGLSACILLLGATKDADLEQRLEAAVHREVVLGDLAGAIAEYKSILAVGSKLRATEARALFRIGLCLEKSGSAGDAREVYERLVTEYAGYESAAQARAKLDNWRNAIIGPLNLKFEQGQAGKLPPAWFAPALPNEADQQAQLRKRGCMSGSGCAVVMAPEHPLAQIGTLMQSFSAAAWRGKTVRVGAWMRLEPASANDYGQIWIGVDRLPNVAGELLRSETWAQNEIRLRIPADASFIKFGVSSVGKGKVWVDDVSFETVQQQLQ
jgi:hypothetical protein